MTRTMARNTLSHTKIVQQRRQFFLDDGAMRMPAALDKVGATASYLSFHHRLSGCRPNLAASGMGVIFPSLTPHSPFHVCGATFDILPLSGGATAVYRFWLYLLKDLCLLLWRNGDCFQRLSGSSHLFHLSGHLAL